MCESLRRLFKGWTRDAVGWGLAQTGLSDFGRTQRGRLPIVTFHRVLPRTEIERYPLRSIAVTPEELAWFLETFSETFTCTTLREAAEMWRKPRGKPPLAVTFDDGQRDNLVHAAPVLENARARATFFVTSGGAENGTPLWHNRMATALVRLLESSSSNASPLVSQVLPGSAARLASGEDPRLLGAEAVERAKAWSPSDRLAWIAQADTLVGPAPTDCGDMLDPADLKALIAAGHEIGCHSHSHEILPALDDDQLRFEIVESKGKLEALTGQACVSFSYPNGNYDSRCLALVRQHFRYGVTVEWGSNRPSDDVARWRRFDMVADNTRSRSGKLSRSRLAWRISGFHPGLGR